MASPGLHWTFVFRCPSRFQQGSSAGQLSFYSSSVEAARGVPPARSRWRTAHWQRSPPQTRSAPRASQPWPRETQVCLTISCFPSLSISFKSDVMNGFCFLFLIIWIPSFEGTNSLRFYGDRQLKRSLWTLLSETPCGRLEWRHLPPQRPPSTTIPGKQNRTFFPRAG